MKDAPDFLSDEPSSVPATEAQAPETPPVAKEAPVVAPAEGPATLAEAPETAEPAAPHHVPLSTFLDMRDRLAAADKRATEAEQWRQEQEARARQQPIPDRNLDPDAFEDHRAQQYDNRLLNITLDNSERFAVIAHGKEDVEAAKTWALKRYQEDPFYQQKVLSAPDAYEMVVQDYRQSQALSALSSPDDLTAFLAWKAAQAPAGHPPQTPLAPAIRAAPAAPRASLAGAPSAGRSSAPEALDGEATFGKMFG